MRVINSSRRVRLLSANEELLSKCFIEVYHGTDWSRVACAHTQEERPHALFLFPSKNRLCLLEERISGGRRFKFGPRC